jgi:hypothetical protein
VVKASFTLHNGTKVILEGEKTDIQDLLDYYSNHSQSRVSEPAKTQTKTKPKSSKQEDSSGVRKASPDLLAQIVNMIKTCPEADAIERNILGRDKPSEADRVLLPLYIVHEYFENSFGLTTFDIETITTNLGPGLKVKRQNANRQFVRTSTSRLVLSDKTRKTGAKMKYTLNDRGVQSMKAVIEKPIGENNPS